MPDLAEQIRGFIDSGATPVTAQEVVEARRSSVTPAMNRARNRRPRRMKTYAVAATRWLQRSVSSSWCSYSVRWASPSKSTVVSPGPSTAIPASWQKVTFGGLTMYTPRNWPTVRSLAWGNCGFGDQPFEFSTVVLDSGTQGVNVECPIDGRSLTRPVYGLLVDPGHFGPLSGISGLNKFKKCLHVNGLSVCPTSMSYSAALVLSVHIPGRNPTRCSRDWSGGWWKGGPHH